MTFRVSGYIISLIFFLNCAVYGQRNTPERTSSLYTGTNNQLNFPNDVLGTYKGNLTIYTSEGVEIVPMSFNLDSTAVKEEYDYIITYNINQVPQKRAYTLIAKNEATGDYIIDENNGIILDAKVIENRLITIFEVNSNLLTTNLYFYQDYLLFEITSSAITAKNKSETDGKPTIAVFSYPINTVQSAKLYKQ